MNETNVATVDEIDSLGVNPALWRLKHEAEAEVKRLRAEYEQVSPGVARGRLRSRLNKAERQLELEITSIRQAALPEALRENHTLHVNRELTELLEAGMRILTDYTDRLDRLVESALTIWDRREKRPIHNTSDMVALAPTGSFELTDYAKQRARNKDVAAAVGRDLDPLLRMALGNLGDEFLAVSEPLQWWITKLSAVHEEGRLTEVQRMELRLRLTDLEVKFQTAGRLFEQFNVLGPT